MNGVHWGAPGGLSGRLALALLILVTIPAFVMLMRAIPSNKPASRNVTGLISVLFGVSLFCGIINAFYWSREMNRVGIAGLYGLADRAAFMSDVLLVCTIVLIATGLAFVAHSRRGGYPFTTLGLLMLAQGIIVGWIGKDSARAADVLYWAVANRASPPEPFGWEDTVTIALPVLLVIVARIGWGRWKRRHEQKPTKHYYPGQTRPMYGIRRFRAKEGRRARFMRWFEAFCQALIPFGMAMGGWYIPPATPPADSDGTEYGVSDDDEKDDH